MTTRISCATVRSWVRPLPPGLVFLLLGAGSSGLAQVPDYAWPLKRYAGCTSLFGDYRPGRYHAGLDLRTDGEVGWPVVAVADGYIMRVSTSYYGYGRALYLKLDDGRVAVYAHLQEFGPQVTQRVRQEQLRTRRYRTNLHFGENEIRVSRGMTIARAGQSGAGAPHLHFEIRTADNKPLNPGWQGFPVTDRRDPEIAGLWLVPHYLDGRMGWGPGGPDPVELQLSGNAHTPLRPSGGTVFAAGPVGFAVEAYDRKPNSESRHNISGVLLVVSGDTLFRARFDTLDYETSDQIRLERVLWLNPEGDTYALYKSPGNVMSHSRASPEYPRGLFTVKPGDAGVPFELVVTDERGNRRTVRGALSYQAPESLYVQPPLEPLVMRAQALDLRPDRARGLAADLEARGLAQFLLPISNPVTAAYRLHASDLKDSLVWHEATEPLLDQTTVLALSPEREHRVWLPDSSLEIVVPRQSVYEPTFLVVRRLERADGTPEIVLEPTDLLLRTPLSLSFKAPEDPRWALFSLNGSGSRLSFVENRRREGRIQCTAGGPVRYTFGVDSLPPSIRRVRPADDAVVGREPVIVARLEDDLSGVGDDTLITVTVDGEWVIPEYDPETKQLVARSHALKPGSHRLELEVYDWAGNVSRVSRSFHVK